MVWWRVDVRHRLLRDSGKGIGKDKSSFARSSPSLGAVLARGWGRWVGGAKKNEAPRAFWLFDDVRHGKSSEAGIKIQVLLGR